MYINKTTAEERVIIEANLDSVMLNVETALTLLDEVDEKLWEHMTLSNDQDKERFHLLHHAIWEMLFNATLEYRLITGQHDSAVDAYMQGAETAKEIRAVTVASDQVCDLARGRKDYDAIITERIAAMKLPDGEALPALETIIKKWR